MDERRLTFGEHLEELRYRLIISLLAVAAAFVVCWLFRIPLLNLLAAPHQQTMRALGFAEDLKVTTYTEAFMTVMKVCIVAAVFLASPIVIYEVWMFIAAGLYAHERRYVYLFAPICAACFMIGMLFGYFLLIPFGLRFLLVIVGDVATPIIKISDYVSLLMLMTLALGLVFQLPLVLLFLVKIGIVSVETLREERRLAIVGAFVLGAVLTPSPDPGSQLMLAIPLIGLYEIGILIAAPSWPRFLRFMGAVLAGGAVVAAVAIYGHSRAMRAGELASGAAVSEARGTALKPGDRLRAGSLLRTDASSTASFRLAAGAELRMNGDTEVRILTPTSLGLQRGEVWIAAGNSPFLLRTSDGVVTIKSCEADLSVGEPGTTLVVCKGSAAVATRDGAQREVLEGRKFTFKFGGEPVDVESATRWTRKVPK